MRIHRTHFGTIWLYQTLGTRFPTSKFQLWVRQLVLKPFLFVQASLRRPFELLIIDYSSIIIHQESSSWLKAHGQGGPPPWAPGPGRPPLAMSHEPWALSHEPWVIKHEASSIKYQYRLMINDELTFFVVFSGNAVPLSPTRHSDSHPCIGTAVVRLSQWSTTEENEPPAENSGNY